MAAAAAAAEAREEDRAARQHAYTSGIFLYTREDDDAYAEGGASSMLSTVLSGLRAGSKRPQSGAPAHSAAAAASATSCGSGPPKASETDESDASLANGWAPCDVPFDADSWVGTLSGSDEDVTVAYAPSTAESTCAGAGASAGASDQSAAQSATTATPTRWDEAEVVGVGNFAAVAVAGISLELPPASAASASTSSAVAQPRTVRAYYEVDVLPGAGAVQIGWAHPECRVDMAAGEGIGDDTLSWAWDGARKTLFNGTETHVASAPDWSAPVTVGCALTLAASTPHDAPRVTMRFYQNGVDTGAAFDFPWSPPAVATRCRFFPALSLDAASRVRIRLGATGFCAPLPSVEGEVGWQPVCAFVAAPRADAAASPDASSSPSNDADAKGRDNAQAPAPKRMRVGEVEAGAHGSAPSVPASSSTAVAPSAAPASATAEHWCEHRFDVDAASEKSALDVLTLNELKAQLHRRGLKCGYVPARCGAAHGGGACTCERASM